MELAIVAEADAPDEVPVALLQIVADVTGRQRGQRV